MHLNAHLTVRFLTVIPAQTFHIPSRSTRRKDECSPFLLQAGEHTSPQSLCGVSEISVPETLSQTAVYQHVQEKQSSVNLKRSKNMVLKNWFGSLISKFLQLLQCACDALYFRQSKRR